MPASQISLLTPKPASHAAASSQPRQDSGADSRTDDTSFKQELDREIHRKQEPEQVADNQGMAEKTKQKQPHKQDKQDKTDKQDTDKDAEVKDPPQNDAAVAAQVQETEAAVKTVSLETKPPQQEKSDNADQVVAGSEAGQAQAPAVAAGEAIAGQLIAQGGKDMPVEPHQAIAASHVGKAVTKDNTVTVKVAPETPLKPAPQVPTKPVTVTEVMGGSGKTPDPSSAETGEGLQVKSPEPGAETRRTQLFKLSADVEASTQVQKSLTQVNSVQHTSAAYVHTSTARPTDTPLPQAQPGQGSQPPMQGAVQANVNSSQWQQGLGDQMSVMVSGKFHSAELKLHPAHLGPLEVKLHLHDDNKASVHFVSSQVQVRDALDAAIPRLRDLFEQQGLNLANVDVSSQGQQQQGMQDNGAGTAGGMANNHGGSMGDEEIHAQANRASPVLTPAGLSIYA